MGTCDLLKECTQKKHVGLGVKWGRERASKNVVLDKDREKALKQKSHPRMVCSEARGQPFMKD